MCHKNPMRMKVREHEFAKEMVATCGGAVTCDTVHFSPLFLFVYLESHKGAYMLTLRVKNFSSY
jgi:hypothetical protein